MAQIILVASGKGGSGKSSFVTGVGRALTALGKKVLVVDCDIGLRSLDIMLDVTEKVVFDWGDLLCERCTAEQAVIKGSIDLLAAPRSFSDELTPEATAKLFKSFSEDYDYILGNIEKLVIKDVAESGGYGVVFGSELSLERVYELKKMIQPRFCGKGD